MGCYEEDQHEDEVGDCDNDSCGGDCDEHGGDDAGFHDGDGCDNDVINGTIRRMLLVMTLFCEHAVRTIHTSAPWHGYGVLGSEIKGRRL